MSRNEEIYTKNEGDGRKLSDTIIKINIERDGKYLEVEGWFNVAQIAPIKNPIKESDGYSVKDLNEKMVRIRIVSGR